MSFKHQLTSYLLNIIKEIIRSFFSLINLLSYVYCKSSNLVTHSSYLDLQAHLDQRLFLKQKNGTLLQVLPLLLPLHIPPLIVCLITLYYHLTHQYFDFILLRHLYLLLHFLHHHHRHYFHCHNLNCYPKNFLWTHLQQQQLVLINFKYFQRCCYFKSFIQILNLFNGYHLSPNDECLDARLTFMYVCYQFDY
ncbi:transmembrane protein, putative (macronuclear) [Tetrahymena thermophila SB210]|uniref:Transmembrane protein, putative n=1 Tax=Tetrahymena thermophila (strain SB210) TaxID=312017 RepID=W7XDH5_TETTS|nr:transmembrane protein, putative [Tetrahymena thermophila SB210]EWS71881.1 transmembrane protein, putative [Tetrahymena thermophila SB210]|eukprot:XP_012655585.1 transmembrane protein, putative [Tetrahymena thermophila SB210]